MATVTLYIELESIAPVYGEWISRVNIGRTRKKAPKEATEGTRWVLLCLNIEDPDTLFKEEQEVDGFFGLTAPMVDATLAEEAS